MKLPFRGFRPMDPDAMDMLRRRMEYAAWAATVQPPVTDEEAQAAARADDYDDATRGYVQALTEFREGRDIAADVDDVALRRAARIRAKERDSASTPVKAWRRVLAADLYAHTRHTEETT